MKHPSKKFIISIRENETSRFDSIPASPFHVARQRTVAPLLSEPTRTTTTLSTQPTGFIDAYIMNDFLLYTLLRLSPIFMGGHSSTSLTTLLSRLAAHTMHAFSARRPHLVALFGESLAIPLLDDCSFHAHDMFWKGWGG